MSAKKYKCSHCGKKTRVRQNWMSVSAHGMGRVNYPKPIFHADKNEPGLPVCTGYYREAEEIK